MVYGVIGKVKVHPGKKYHYVATSCSWSYDN
jgi:hypothetical protein